MFDEISFSTLGRTGKQYLGQNDAVNTALRQTGRTIEAPNNGGFASYLEQNFSETPLPQTRRGRFSVDV